MARDERSTNAGGEAKADAVLVDAIPLDVAMAQFDALPRELRDVANYAPVKCGVHDWPAIVRMRGGPARAIAFLEAWLVKNFDVARGPEIRPGARRRRSR